MKGQALPEFLAGTLKERRARRGEKVVSEHCSVWKATGSRTNEIETTTPLPTSYSVYESKGSLCFTGESLRQTKRCLPSTIFF